MSKEKLFQALEESNDVTGLSDFEKELVLHSPSTRKVISDKFVLAALGSIPWVGGFIAAAASIKTDENANKPDDIRTAWLKEHEEKIRALATTINDIQQRFDSLGQDIEDRIGSEEYLDIVRKAFRVWNDSDTDEKRLLVANLITNAGGTQICSDDVLRLFIDWLERFHEAHFSVIREIYNQPSPTRLSIWEALHQEVPKDNSAEADLYKMLIRDMSTAGIIRQSRAVNHDGEYLAASTRRRGQGRRTTLETPFEGTKVYELTALGEQFVHYVMNDAVARIAN